MDTLAFLFSQLVLCLVILIHSIFTNESVDIHDIKLTGPGLWPDRIVMPARYFFVHFNGKEASTSRPLKSHTPPIDGFKIEITGTNIYQRDCRIWKNILDRKDGSFIVRYKVYETCYNMQISVQFNGADVGGSPITMDRPVQPDDCYCPTSMENWLRDYECPSHYAQINKDLEPFLTVNFTSFHQHVVDKVDKSGSMSVCNYIILNNEVFRKCYGEHVGFKTFMDAVLISLARKFNLPDTELFVNLGDWPLVKKDSHPLFPILSWCGSNSSMDIVIPTYDITESSLEMMGRVSLDMLSVQGNTEVPWTSKEKKAFWRGRDSSRERLKLIEIARKHPNLFNASLTNFFFFRDKEDIYGPKEKHISFFKFFDYRYQICMDGTVAAYRLPYLLAGDALVLKQESEYYEHFYNELEPWRHYVPVKHDLSDLVEQVQWAREHDDRAHEIALTGQKFARNNLLPQHIFCYHAVLLKEWSKRLMGKVKIRKGMEKVPQTENKHCVCSHPKINDEL